MTFQKESGKEGLKILLMLASVIIITAGLQAGKPVLLPIVLSGFLAIVSYPLTTFFKSRLCFPHCLEVGGQPVLGRQGSESNPSLPSRHG